MSSKIKSEHYYFLSILVLSAFYIREVAVQNPPIIRSCQDPLVLDHINKYAHTYCFHACALLENGVSVANDSTVCTAGGDCLCSYACSNDAVITQPAIQYDSQICNPPSAVNDPPDPDPNALPQCMARCASQCVGGTGTICGEVDLLGQNMDTYAKICTCYCPVQSCVVPTTTTTTTTTPTSVIIVPPPVIVATPLFILKKFKWKLVLFKLFKLCWLALKVCVLWILQSIFLGIYSFLFYEWISWEYRQVLWGINYFLSSFRRGIVSYFDF